VAQSASQPTLTSADLSTTWRSSDGGSITFAEDHQFSAIGLRLDKFWTGCSGFGEMSVSGTWKFLNSNGDSGPGLTGYPSGSLMSLDFSKASDSPSLGCTGGGIDLTSWNVNSVAGLCLQMDPDTPCDGYIFVRQ